MSVHCDQGQTWNDEWWLTTMSAHCNAWQITRRRWMLVEHYPFQQACCSWSCWLKRQCGGWASTRQSWCSLRVFEGGVSEKEDGRKGASGCSCLCWGVCQHMHATGIRSSGGSERVLCVPRHKRYGRGARRSRTLWVAFAFIQYSCGQKRPSEPHNLACPWSNQIHNLAASSRRGL